MFVFETVPYEVWRSPVQLHLVTMEVVFPLTTVWLAHEQVARGTEGAHDGVTKSLYCWTPTQHPHWLEEALLLGQLQEDELKLMPVMTTPVFW